MHFPGLSAYVLCHFLITSSWPRTVFATRGLGTRAPPLYLAAPEMVARSKAFELAEEMDAGLVLLQRQASVTKIAIKKPKTVLKQLSEKAVTAPQLGGLAMATTTTTTVMGPSYLIVSSTTAGSIFSWGLSAGAPANVLIPDAGSNPTGIALDHNLGYLYYTDPRSRQIIRYVLSIRNGQVDLYDQQPVPIVQNVDADWILVNDYSNIFWTDPVDHSIKKMYYATIELVASGAVQPNQLSDVSYLDIYQQIGGVVPSACIDQKVAFPWNCTANVTCNTCQELSQQPYVYTLYSNIGHPSGMQQMPGNKLLWGNLVDGYKRGTVVEAEAEPTLPAGAKAFSIRPLTYLWDSVFDFYQMPDNAFGLNNLFLTTNGTLGIPPIPGDVVGALVAITPGSSNGFSEKIAMDWNFVRPRALAYNGQSTLFIADDYGIRSVNTEMVMQDAPETQQLVLPGCAGLVLVQHSDACYPLMIERGQQALPPGIG